MAQHIEIPSLSYLAAFRSIISCNLDDLLSWVLFILLHTRSISSVRKSKHRSKQPSLEADISRCVEQQDLANIICTYMTSYVVSLVHTTSAELAELHAPPSIYLPLRPTRFRSREHQLFRSSLG